MNRIIDEQKQVGEWISVKDKMPKETYVPRVNASYSKVVLAIEHEYIIGFTKNGEWYNGYDDDKSQKVKRRVTHWMPLPQPPKEVK